MKIQLCYLVKINGNKAPDWTVFGWGSRINLLPSLEMVEQDPSLRPSPKSSRNEAPTKREGERRLPNIVIQIRGREFQLSDLAGPALGAALALAGNYVLQRPTLLRMDRQISANERQIKVMEKQNDLTMDQSKMAIAFALRDNFREGLAFLEGRIKEKEEKGIDVIAEKELHSQFLDRGVSALEEMVDGDFDEAVEIYFGVLGDLGNYVCAQSEDPEACVSVVQTAAIFPSRQELEDFLKRPYP